jgi:glycosyltransferase involved in cell wall biosynthesis
MVATPTLQKQLETRGFRNIVRWTRGVDVDLFKPSGKGLLDLPRPLFTYVGRVAVEKNIEAFLDLDLPGAKLVIGDGPQRRRLQAEFPTAQFVGYKFGAALAAHLAASDVFVFPSRTDTFGLVLLEALACGVPVAAYPVTGPIDVIENGVTGVLDEDLQAAALAALKLDPAKCRSFALKHSWETATKQFVGNLQPRDPIPGSNYRRAPALPALRYSSRVREKNPQ